MPPELEQTSAPAEPAGMDMEAAATSIAESLNLVQKEEHAPADEPAQPANDEAAPAAESVAQEEPAPAEEPVAEPAATTPEDRPPDTWTKGGKERWASLTPEVKAEIRKREGDIAKFVQESQPALNVAKAFEKILSPFAENYSKYGIDPWRLTAELHAAHNQMVFGTPEQKAALFTALAERAGVDLKALATGTPGQDPNNAHQQELQRLNARIAQLEQGVNGVTSTVQAARVAELEQNVLAFAQDEEAHPYFWEVADDIQRFISSKAATTLEDAYALAVNANPVTRAKLLEAEVQKRNAAQAAEAAAKAAAAKRTAAVNVKSSGKGRVASNPQSIDDTLKEQLAKIHARETT